MINLVLGRKTVRVAALLGVLLAIVNTAYADSKFSFAATPGELPKHVIPLHYAITIRPDLDTLTFQGSETVEVELTTPARNIVLNSLELSISQARLASDTSQIAAIETDTAKQIVTLSFPQELKPGHYKLELAFSGKIGPQPQGLYYDKYQTSTGEKTMLATQMEPTDARRMFPCWDEPVYRATYQLTVVVPEHLMAVSNSPIEVEEPVGAGLKSVRFAPTPKMSSYLVVLVVGELEAIAGESEGVQLRVITTAGKKEKGRYALQVIEQLLPYYNDYFGVKYPLPKLDFIAIPGGFGGAMENWGGITYNESILLFDSATSSQDTKQAIFNVISHEVAHQWFGDLVTTAWWDNLWLNEGFATWMATKATDRFNPEWQAWLRVNSSKDYAMSSDARKTTHPIQQPVRNAADAVRAFDEITYEKGAAFIRMLETYLGEQTFRDGIRRYMAAHQYSSATTADLWEALGEVSGKPVADMAAGWTEQPGFPIISVNSSDENGHRTLTLEQERFLVNAADPTLRLWQIPVTITTAGPNSRVSQALFKTKTMTWPDLAAQTPVKLNAGNAGYYRVKYDANMFKELRGVATLGFSVGDRLNLLTDTWAMVEAGHLSAGDYLDLVHAVREETHLAIWEEIVGNLLVMDSLERGQPGRAAFQSHARSLLNPVFDQVGWDSKPGEDDKVVLLRSRLLTALGSLRDEAVIAEARRRFGKFLDDPGSLPSDLRRPVCSTVGRYADKATYDRLHALGRATQSTEDKRLYYSSMASSLAPELAQESLELALTEELPPMMAPFTVFMVAQGGEQPELAWKFVQQHTEKLLEKLPFFAKHMYVPNVMGTFSDAARADELETYSRAHLPPEAQADVAKQAERIRFAANLKQRELPYIDQWIRDHAK